ncbi:helix-turn-helix domain-containing protein [Pseudooctadecabacter jejudonensis]|nr:helix-turn-helix transcriptional regulator [Pseudooctadecabacter jejudonensis]
MSTERVLAGFEQSVVSSRLQGSETLLLRSLELMTAIDGRSDVKKFGELVRERRIAKGWSLEALAAEAFSNSTRKGYVSQIENGKIPKITQNTVRNVALALEINPDDIPRALRWPEVKRSPSTGGNSIPFAAVSRLFGRDKEIADLENAWNDDELAIVALDAIGGAGKTALVKAFEQKLLDKGPASGLDSIFFWSFFSQGADERRQANGNEFLEEALVFFGYEHLVAEKSFPVEATTSEEDICRRQKEIIRGKKNEDGTVVYPGLSDWKKGVELAKLVSQRRVLLVLDGLEPLQYPSGTEHAAEGALRDLGLKALLQSLAHGASGLTIITTRLRVSDLIQAEETTKMYRSALRPIPLMDAISFLRHSREIEDGVAFGVEPNYPPEEYDLPIRSSFPKSEVAKLPPDYTPKATEQLPAMPWREAMNIVQVACALKGHALALNHVAGYLCEFHGGVADRFSQVPQVINLGGDRDRDPFRVMQAIEVALARRINEVENPRKDQERLAVLFFLGLFDRPMRWTDVEALRAGPPLPGVLGIATAMSNQSLAEALQSLRRQGLVFAADPRVPLQRSDIDCHPLVREYFALRLADVDEATFKSAHRKLYDHYRYSAAGPNGVTLPLEFRNPLVYGVLLACSRFPLQQGTLKEMMSAGKVPLYASGAITRTMQRASSDEIVAASELIDGPQWDRALRALLPKDEIGMRDLFLAIRHGCLAGRQSEALNEVFDPRVRQGRNYASEVLGLHGQELATLSAFFEGGFDEPSRNLSPYDRGFLTNAVALRMKKLGRLEDSEVPQRKAMVLFQELGEWGEATINATNLADVLLLLGNLEGENGAEMAAADAVANSEKCQIDTIVESSRVMVLSKRTSAQESVCAAALAMGNLRAAEKAFYSALSNAEEIRPTTAPWVFWSSWSKDSAVTDLLFAKARYREIAALTELRQLLVSSSPQGLEENADIVLLRAKSALFSGKTLDQAPLDLAEEALELFRVANAEHKLPRGLLTVASAGALAGELERAYHALDELAAMALRGPMPIYACAAELLRSRIALSAGDRHEAKKQRKAAHDLMVAHSLHGVNPELTVLDAELALGTSSFSGAMQAAHECIAGGWWAHIPRIEALGEDCSDLRDAEEKFNVTRNAHMRWYCVKTEEYDPTSDPVALYLAEEYLKVDGFREDMDARIDRENFPDGLASLTHEHQIKGAAEFTSMLGESHRINRKIDADLADPSFVEKLTDVLNEQKGLIFDDLSEKDRREWAYELRKAIKKAEDEASNQKGMMRSHDLMEISDAKLDEVLDDPLDIQKIEEILGSSLTEKFVDLPREAQRKWLSVALVIPQHYVQK